jgi:hypothetical protein
MLNKSHKKKLQTFWTVVAFLTIAGMILLYIMPALN